MTDILNEPEAAKYIGMSRSFLRQDRMNGQRDKHTAGPAWLKIGRSIRYLKSDLDEWLEHCRQVRAFDNGISKTRGGSQVDQG